MVRTIVILILLMPYRLLPQETATRWPMTVDRTLRTISAFGDWEDRTVILSVDTGSIFVPADRLKRDSRRIAIPVVRFHATDTSFYPPIVWLSGGPGQSNMSSLHRDLFIDSSDHVMVGYRGIDGAVSLDCPEVVQALEQAGDILDPEALRHVAEGFGACADRLIREGIDVRHYTPVNVALDIESARAALGIDKITLVGESYGTRVAYYYAILFPEHVHRMVLMGANPPGRMVWDPWQMDSLLGRYGELWKQDSVAVRRAPDLVQAFKQVHANFPKRWLFMPIHEGTVKAGIHSFLFQRETAAQAFDVYVAASQGDASGLWLFSLVGGRIFPDIVNWGDNASKAMSADFDPSRDYLHELMPAGSVFGAPLGAFLWGAGQTGTWPTQRIPDRFHVVERCSTETLMFSGTLDFSTPAINMQSELLPHFPRGHAVVMAEAGHVGDLWNLQPAATAHLLHAFVRRGEIDTTEFRYVPMSFQISWGFPLLAKLVVGGILLVVFLIVWGGWKLSRRWRRHPRAS